MKTKILILTLSCISYFGYSQIDILSTGNVGIGTITPSTLGGYEKVLDINGNSSSKVSTTTNTNSITTSLMSSIYGNWGAVGTQSNHRFLFFVNNSSKMSIETNGEIRISDNLRLGSYNNTIKLATIGSFGQVSGFDFNTSTSTPGITFEQGASESSGFYSDGDYAVIWSPGDQNRLLRVYDEDNMSEKWYLDGSGYAYTVSDSSTKENINYISSALSGLSKIKGVKYNYKKENDNQQNLSLNSNSLYDFQYNKGENGTDSLFFTLDNIIDPKKYNPADKKYFGFIAQEVETVFPDLVETDIYGKKFVSYIEFIPLLVEGLKEQQVVIEEQKTQIADLTKRVEELEKEIQKIYSILGKK